MSVTIPSGDESKRTSLEHNVTYYDQLTLRPSDPSIVASVPRPRRARLSQGLPMWNKKPLDSKLPLMQGPRGPFVFTRGELGKPLWKGAPHSQFHLSDPYNREVRFDYEPAHDKHLRKWLYNSPQFECFVDQNLLVENSYNVKCTVEQYNFYRQFLNNLYRDAVKKKIEHKERLAIEKLMIKKATEGAEKEAAKIKKFEDGTARRMSNENKLKAMEMERLERCRKRLQRVIDRAALAEQRKIDDQLMRKKKMEAFDEKIRSRITNANYIERQNKIKAMKAWHKMDVEKKKQFELREKQRKQANRKKAEERWNRKVEEQHKQIAKEKLLRTNKRLAKENFKFQYMKVMEKEWTRMKDELNLRKCRGTLDKVKERRTRSMREIMNSMVDAYSTQKVVSRLSQDQEAISVVMNRIKQALKEIRYDLEPYIVIAHAKSRIERQENVPLPVGTAIKFLLEQVIVEYTGSRLLQTVSDTARKVLTAIDELHLSQGSSAENRSLSLKRSSFSTHNRLQSISLSMKTTRVSDAGVQEIPVYKDKSELVVEVEALRSVKDRPPTPMPSIATLTEILFNEPTPEEFEEEYFGEYPFIEQQKLNMSINNLSNRIFRMINLRVRAVVQSRSYDRISSVSSTVDGIDLPENKPVAKLCSLILFEDTVREHVLTQIVDRMILGFMKDVQMTPSFLRLKIKQRLESVK